MTIRLAFLVQLVLGIGLWTGKLDSLKGVHILVGIAFVLALWSLSLLAARAGAPPVLVALSFGMGIVVAVLGLTQEGILVGGSHWLVQLAHLLIGGLAVGLAERIGKRI
ncbi:MAG TPA: hypothetical protein VG015_09620 [Candidatus Dormibacteraeota bacterium]|jgi:hypothetical protein|nr:hypothetical protein [Candidatus Dormibacteraeota bacterium]